MVPPEVSFFPISCTWKATLWLEGPQTSAKESPGHGAGFRPVGHRGSGAAGRKG
jgi:hypothetical protein